MAPMGDLSGFQIPNRLQQIPHFRLVPLLKLANAQGADHANDDRHTGRQAHGQQPVPRPAPRFPSQQRQPEEGKFKTGQQ